MKAREGFDPVHISQQLCTSYLEQVCRHGFFHCDPHPGNLAVDDGYPGGRLVYYDFGMMERMEPEIKKGFVDLIFSIYENLPREATDALEQMGVLRAGADKQSIESIARDMLSQFQSTLASADNKWENQMTPEEKKAARRARRAKLGQDLFATQSDKPLPLPAQMDLCLPCLLDHRRDRQGARPGRYDLAHLAAVPARARQSARRLDRHHGDQGGWASPRSETCGHPTGGDAAARGGRAFGERTPHH